MKTTISVSGVNEAAAILRSMQEAARVLAERPVSIGPTVSYGLAQEVKRGYMAAGLARVQGALPGLLAQALLRGPAVTTSAIDKIARDIQAGAMAAAPVRTGALRSSIGIFYGSSTSGGDFGGVRTGKPSPRSKIVGRGRRR